MTNITTEKWIAPVFTLDTMAFGIIKLKNEFKPYAEELGWKVVVDKKGYINENAVKMFHVEIVPVGKKCSPKELIERKDLLRGFTFSILGNTIYKDTGIPKNFNTTWRAFKYKEDGNYMLELRFAEAFIIVADLKKIIKLEIEHPELSLLNFDCSMKKWYQDQLKILKRKAFMSKKRLEDAKEIMNILESCGMPKLSLKKQFFRINAKEF